MNYTRKDAINRLLDGIGLTYDENYYYKKISDLEKENIDKELEIKNLIDFRLSSDVFTDDEYIATIYKSHKKRIELNNIKIDSLKNDLATKIAGNSRLKYLKDYLSSEKLLYKQQVNDFMQNIIVISQHEVVFVQGDFKIPEKEFGDYVKDILKLKPIKKGSIYIEQRHENYKYSVVKYDERILKV